MQEHHKNHKLFALRFWVGYICALKWRGGRVAEGARLESGYTFIAYRGFKSLPLRHIKPLSRKGFFMPDFCLSKDASHAR